VTAVDLGTGSGVIALSLAAEWDTVVPPGARPRLEVWATDASAGALEVFESNLDRLRGRDGAAADRVRVVSGSWFDALPRELRGQVNVIVSNPPYVSAAEWSELDGAVRDHEPKTALVAGPTGLEALETVLVGARRWLAPDGVLVVELAPHQAAALERIATGSGYDAVDVRPDLTGRARVLVAHQPGDRRR
jgi:release factor glutamine methyltransferase